MSTMGSGDRGSSGTGRRNLPPRGSRLLSSNPMRSVCVAYLVGCILSLVIPGECISISRSGPSEAVKPKNSSSPVALQLRAHFDRSLKKERSDLKGPHEGSEHAHEKTDSGVSEHESPGREAAPQLSAPEHQHTGDDFKTRDGIDVEDKPADAKSSTSEKPPEQLGEKELMELPYGDGIRAVLTQGRTLVSMLDDGLAESRALKEAAIISTKLRGEIVKDVDALSHTLQEEHANLVVLREYEREQDSLLKAQLGYLTPMAGPRIKETSVFPSSAESSVAMSLDIALACTAFFYFLSVT